MKQKFITFLKDTQLLKLFIYMLSMRRNFFPLVSVYFLMLPNTLANQIGIFTGIGFILQILLEIPSGYLSDVFGHKKILIFSKVCAIFSVTCYILGGTIFVHQAFLFFTLAAIFQSGMFTLNSGTFAAFFHNLMEERGQKNEYTKVLSKMRANVSLVAIFFIFTLPFFTKISLVTPFIIAGVIDLIGLRAITTVVNTKQIIIDIESEEESKTIGKIFSEAQSLGFIPMAMFSASIAGIMIGSGAFRSVYMTDIGLPLIWVGSVMALSRLVRFIIGHYMHLVEEYFTMKQHFFIEIFVFSGSLLLVGFFPNMYVVGAIFAFIGGYQWARGALVSKYIFEKYSPDKRYKATILSMKSQFVSMVGIIVSFGIGYVMNVSYQLGFLVLGFVCLIGMSVSFFFIFKKQENTPQ